MQVTDPLIFFGVAAALMAYLVYMMVRTRKGERPGFRERETDL